jgi:hypothetical protein
MGIGIFPRVQRSVLNRLLAEEWSGFSGLIMEGSSSAPQLTGLHLI